MDGDFRLDLGEVAKNLETAEVVCIYFSLLRKTLLIDTRYDVEDEPHVKIVPMANSVEERFRSIKRLRPRFPRPESITVIPWPKYVDSIVRLGLWDKLVGRFVSLGQKGAIRACQRVLEELRNLERQELHSAIKGGEQYYNLWEAKK